MSPIVAVLLLLGLSAIGAVVDLSLGHGLDVAYAILFVAGCGVAAVGVQRGHLLVPVFAPALVFGGTVLTATLANTSPLSLVNVAADGFIRLLEGAPVLFAGTLLALVVVLFRRLRG